MKHKDKKGNDEIKMARRMEPVSIIIDPRGIGTPHMIPPPPPTRLEVLLAKIHNIFYYWEGFAAIFFFLLAFYLASYLNVALK